MHGLMNLLSNQIARQDTNQWKVLEASIAFQFFPVHFYLTAQNPPNFSPAHMSTRSPAVTGSITLTVEDGAQPQIALQRGLLASGIVAWWPRPSPTGLTRGWRCTGGEPGCGGLCNQRWRFASTSLLGLSQAFRDPAHVVPRNPG